MIYHYTNSDGLSGILSSKCLWLVSSQSMSDITDRFYGNLFTIIALLRSKDKDVELLRNHLSNQDILDVNMQTFQVDFYSASFCNRSDNEYLWEHYADSNKGFCIEIDETLLNDYLLTTIKEKYNYLEGDEEGNIKNDFLLPRKVLYHYPASDFEKLIKRFKPDQHVLAHNCNAYKNWLFLVICILAGIVKAKEFEKEEEIRLLFQNRYSDEYVEHSGIFALEKERIINGFETLGIHEEIRDEKNRRMELNLRHAFGSSLIPQIIVGSEYSESICDLKTKIKESGLVNTILLNKKGEEL